MPTTPSATVRVLESQIDVLAGRVVTLERQCRGLINVLLDRESKDPPSSRYTGLMTLRDDDYTSRSAASRHGGERYDRVRALDAERRLGRDDERLALRLRDFEVRLDRLEPATPEQA